MRILFIAVMLAMCGTGIALSAMLLEQEKYKGSRWVKLALVFYLACLFLAFR